MPSVTPELPRPAHIPSPSWSDLPSLIYLGLLALNTLIILLNPWPLLNVVFIVVQGFFFVGLLEMTHQCVHHAFIARYRRINEIVGLIAAALIGINMVTYRYFHLQHHRHTCDQQDPEGHLYADSPRTRWFFLVAPIAHVYVAVGINRLAAQYVPARKRGEWQRARLVLVSVMMLLALVCAWNPAFFLQAYLLPLCLFAWFDFLFSQAEHYGADIRDADAACNVASVSYDVTAPRWLSHLMLNRNLHRVHHVWPRTRWFEAQARQRELDAIQPGRVLSFSQFSQRWFTEGPRLWR